jgi:hypothetical protein
MIGFIIMIAMHFCMINEQKRVIARYEAISKLYRAALQIGDCFVPRNDA